MADLNVNLENLTEEERKQLVALIEKANKPKSKVWKPQKEDNYYYIDINGNVESTFWANACFDYDLYAIGNCYRTKEEAEWQVEHLKVKAELKRFAEEHNEHQFDNSKYELRWKIMHELGGSILPFASMNIDTLSADTIYFTSNEIANEAIEEIGEDRLKKYYFGVMK